MACEKLITYWPNKALQPTPSRFAGWGCSDPLLAAHLRVGLIARSGWLSLTLGPKYTMRHTALLFIFLTIVAIAVNALFWDRCFDAGTGFAIILWNIPSISILLFITWRIMQGWPSIPIVILCAFWISQLLCEIPFLNQSTQQYGLHQGIEAQGSGLTKLLFITLTFFLSLATLFISWISFKNREAIQAQQGAAANP